MVSWPEAGGPWERVHIDYAPRFHGFALLIVVDAYSKWVEVGITRPDQMSAEKTISLLKTFVSRYGFVKMWFSDNGTQFVSQQFQDFVASMGAVHRTTAPYFPASNGQAERVVQLVKRGLSKILPGGGRMESAVEDFLFHYRHTPHSVTGVSPAELFLGRQIRNRLTLLADAKAPSIRPQVYAPPFGPGKDVWMRSFAVRTPRWVPAQVTQNFGNRHFQVCDGEGNLFRRHVDQLRARR